MRFAEFRDAIREELHENIDGLTWAELKERLDLPYERPCQTWLKRLEKEIGLLRVPGRGRGYVWKVDR
jgi:hypothetical protein